MPTPREILSSVFGYDRFIGLQEPIIDHVLAGGDGLALMPTGGGKSLCYQIPSILLPGTGLVVSPLIALMQDQVRGLLQAGVRAACLNSALPPEECRETERRFLRGELDLLYVAPERICRPDFLAMLATRPPALFAIDEAHCVSRWGHDFRPEYRELHVLGQRFPGVPRLALTATADTPTRNDILGQLGMEGAEVFSGGFDRPNIRYEIAPKDREHRQLAALLDSGLRGQSGIVYRMSRKKVEDTAEFLKGLGIEALPYHAGLDAATRSRNQERFMREEGVVMVATIAFGMGVDKPDVRFVAHLDPPRSLEAYHQETGRAGRDGQPALAWMCFGLRDISAMRWMLESSDADPGFKRIEHRKLNALLGFCETAACRRTVLLGYFGDKRSEPCGNCDNCLAPPTTWDGTEAAQKALSNVYRTGQRFGAAHLTDVLLGAENKKISMLGHDALSTHGIGGEHSRAQWLSIHRQLVSSGLLEVDIERHGGLFLNAASWEILRGQRTVRFRTDPVAALKKARKAAPLPHGLPGSPDSDRLMESLRKLRLNLAEERNVPPYAIFPDTTLAELTAYRPENLEDMGRISGMGLVKLERFGPAFLEALKEHAREHGRPDTLPPLPDRPTRSEKMKRDGGITGTIQTTLDMLAELGSPEAVAEARDLKENTVYTHVVKGLKLGRLTLDQAVALSDGEFEAVRDALNTHGPLLTPVMEALGNAYPYNIVRCVQAWLERDGQGFGPGSGDEKSGPPTLQGVASTSVFMHHAEKSDGLEET